MIAERSTTIARIGRQIADALQYAHEQGVLHRDVKPSNIMLDRNGTAWLADFGLAKLVRGEDAASLTEDGNLLGTLRYLPPENLRGEVDARGDVYSLGLALYELVALTPALDGSSHVEFIEKLKEGRIERLERRTPDVPRDLATIIHKAIDLHPDARYQTAGELADDLRRFLDDEPIKARRVSATEHLVRWSRRNRGLSVALASLAALLVITAVASVFSAGYFRSLNTTLNTTIGKLEESQETIREEAARNLQLAGEARQAEGKARDAESEAREAERASLTLLADMHASRGVQETEAGRHADAMLWFASAALQTPHDPDRQLANGLRAANAMARSPLPVAYLRLPTPGDARRVEFQPGGRLLMVVKPPTLQIHDCETDQPLDWVAGVEDVQDCVWSPDGRSVAVGLTSGQVEIRHAESGEIAHTVKTNGPVSSLTFSNDGSLLATGQAVVQVWELSDKPTLKHEWNVPAPARSLVFSPADEWLVAGCQDKVARVFTIGASRASEIESLPHATGFNNTAPVFLSDHTLAAVREGREARVWDLTTGRDVTPESSGPLPVRITLVRPNRFGKGMIGVGWEGAAVWDKSGSGRAILTQHSFVRDAAFTPDGALLALTDRETRLLLPPWPNSDSISIRQLDDAAACAVSTDGRLIAVCDISQVRVLERPEPLSSKVASDDWPDMNFKPRLSFDRRLVTPGSTHEWPGTWPGFRVIRADTGQPAGPRIPLTKIRDSCFCSDNRSLAVVHDHETGGRLTVLDIESGEPKYPPLTIPPPHCVASSPTRPVIAALCITGELFLVNSQTGELLTTLDHDGWEFQGDIRGWNWSDRTLHSRVTWSPDGKSLITVTPGDRLFVRDSSTHELRFDPIRLKARHIHGVCVSIDVSPDSQTLAVGVTGARNNLLHVLDLETGEFLCEPIAHPGAFWGLRTVNFTPDGRHVMTGCVDGLARLWDWQSGTLAGPPIQNNGTPIRGLAFPGDDRFCVTLDRLATVRLWEMATGRPVGPPIQYPNNSRITTSITDLAATGDLAFVNDQSSPVIDLAPILTPPARSPESLLAIAELCSSSRLIEGKQSEILPDEWKSRWEALKDRPRPEDRTVRVLTSRFDKHPGLPSSFLTGRAGVSRQVLEELLRERPQLPQAHTALAHLLDQEHLPELASHHRKQAVEILEQRIAASPPAADLDHLAAELADLLLHGDLATWQPLDAASIRSKHGATFEQLADGSVLVSGVNEASDVYQLDLPPVPESIAAIRLEVLPHPSLPFGACGRHPNGNFELNAIRLFDRSANAGATPTPLDFSEAWASYQPKRQAIDVAGLIDPEKDTHWQVWERRQQPNFAVFRLQEPVAARPLGLEIVNGIHQSFAVNLGRFRLSFSADDRAIEHESVRQFLSEGELPAVERLAATYQVYSEPAKAVSLLDGHTSRPESSAYYGLRLLLLSEAHEQLDHNEASANYRKQLDSWERDHSLPPSWDCWPRE